jgi:hypothetical protein
VYSGTSNILKSFLLRTSYLQSITYLITDEEKLKDILCNNWIARQFEIGWQLPTEVIIWLLRLGEYSLIRI